MRGRTAWKLRAAALGLAAFGAVTNLAVATHLLSFSRVLKWESDSEWESSAQEWRIDSIKLVWALMAAYFVTATVACLVGVVGVVKRTPSFVRLFRDYSVADLCFCGLFAIFAALASFRPGTRATVCEELSRQPELLRDLAEAGLNLENCELWFEHAVVAVVAVIAILLVVRVQFILTVSNYYAHLLRQRMYDQIELSDTDSEQRIFLLPARTVSPGTASKQSQGAPPDTNNSITATSTASATGAKGTILVYAPVSIDSLSEAEARELAATEAWVTRSRGLSGTTMQGLSHSRTRRHSYSQMHGRRSSSNSRRHGLGHSHSLSHGHGRISLPIHPDEGLLPSYSVNPDLKS